MSPFLSDYAVPKEFITQVEKLIRATGLNYQPENLLERIIRDADTRHLGSADYSVWAQRLKQELEFCDGLAFTEMEWVGNNIDFFKEHQFYTDYARQHWNGQKRINLAKLEVQVA